MTKEQAVVGAGQVVGMHYSLFRAKGELIESTEGRDPILFLYGDHQVLAALQTALNGKTQGDHVVVDISHEQAYGRHYPDRVKRIPRKHIDGAKQQSFRIGQIIHVKSEQGQRTTASVIKVGKFTLDIDTNHPLAGQDLRFEVTIDQVRPATEDEVAHGHAHGPGGHQH